MEKLRIESLQALSQDKLSNNELFYANLLPRTEDTSKGSLKLFLVFKIQQIYIDCTWKNYVQQALSRDRKRYFYKNKFCRGYLPKDTPHGSLKCIIKNTVANRGRSNITRSSKGNTPSRVTCLRSNKVSRVVFRLHRASYIHSPMGG